MKGAVSEIADNIIFVYTCPDDTTMAVSSNAWRLENPLNIAFMTCTGPKDMKRYGATLSVPFSMDLFLLQLAEWKMAFPELIVDEIDKLKKPLTCGNNKTLYIFLQFLNNKEFVITGFVRTFETKISIVITNYMINPLLDGEMFVAVYFEMIRTSVKKYSSATRFIVHSTPEQNGLWEKLGFAEMEMDIQMDKNQKAMELKI